MLTVIRFFYIFFFILILKNPIYSFGAFILNLDSFFFKLKVSFSTLLKVVYSYLQSNETFLYNNFDEKDTKTKKSTVPRSLCIRTHDQLILPIFGPILTSSSRAQSTIYFCTLSIRHLINSTPKSTTFYSSPAGYFGICEMKFQKNFNG